MQMCDFCALFFFLGAIFDYFIVQPLTNIIVRLIEKLISKWRNKK